MATETPCPSLAALVRIAEARWTPYIANTFQEWASQALIEPAACAQSREDDCVHCLAATEIVSYEWTVALAFRIQERARDVLGLRSHILVTTSSRREGKSPRHTTA